MNGSVSPMRYLHYDVFTDRRFEGNQLAVFPDARDLSSDQMQTVAKEMNFSESTFVLPAERPDTDVRLRIFTPGSELPWRDIRRSAVRSRWRIWASSCRSGTA